MWSAARNRLGIVVFGFALIGVGVLLIGIPVYTHLTSTQTTDNRGDADKQALAAWNSGGSASLAGNPNGIQDPSGSVTNSCTPGAAPPDAYALVQFTSLGALNYAGVAGDGSWDLLHKRSMVHYTGTADPGGWGNAIIGFHREPNYEHIDQLDRGGVITIVDRQCHHYVYTVQQRWELTPDEAAQHLEPTTGHDLTLVTCTPFWVDTDRYVWRASLTSVDGKPAAA